MTERTIFLQALDQPSAAERAAFVAGACGDDAELRRRVEALLHSHGDAGHFLDVPALEQDACPEETRTGDTPSDGDELALDFLAPPRREGALGRLDHYEVLEVVGRGGMGLVMKAFDEKLHRVVALKVMAREVAATTQARKRFAREAKAAAAVVHDHIVPIHAIEDAGPVPYLVMQFVAGRSLQQKIDDEGSLDLKEILRIGMQAACGLAAAHKQGLVHRDVKPSNILLENGVQRVKITDFGLARASDDASVTQTGAIAGTPQYMSPEQADGRTVDARSDLFSLGSVLYAMCTGRAPFRADSTVATLRRVCDDAPRPIRALNPDIPDWLEVIVAKLHAKNPADRFQSSAEVADLLERHLAHVQRPREVARPAAVAPPPPPAAQPNHLRGAVAVVVAILLGLVPAYFFYRIVSEADRGPYHPVAQRGTLVLEAEDPATEVNVVLGDTVFHEGSTRREFDLPATQRGYVVVLKPSGDPLFRKDFAIAAGEVTRIDLDYELAIREKRARTTVDGDKLKKIGEAVRDFEPLRDFDEPGFEPLFNGRDLTGWTGVPDSPGPWSVKDGVLRGGGATSLLMASAREYGDFHLRCRVRISDGGDSGIHFRCDKTRLRNGWAYGYEAMINATIPSAPRTGSLEDTFANYQTGKDPLVKPGEWFTYEIVARGNRIQLKVNGATTLEWTDGNEQRARGHFALQLPDATTVVEFRRIEIKELPADGR